MRQIVLDTETTGLEPANGHRIIEIGCVELVNRRLTGARYHQYLNPERAIDEGAVEVHGLTSDFLSDKPLFEDVVDDFLAFVDGAELVIHNASFDVGFINHEIKRLKRGLKPVDSRCGILDTLKLAREKHPGQKNNLDALCKRYEVDNSQRDLHGALLDAEILADVYLAMTGGQTALFAEDATDEGPKLDVNISRSSRHRPELCVIKASDEERRLHEARLDAIEKSAGGHCLWRELELS